MMKKIIVIVAAVATVAANMFAPVAVSVATDVCSSSHVDMTSDAYRVLCAKKGETDAEAAVKKILETVFVWTGIISVIVIIIGGIYYTTSQGDPGKVRKAKDTILYAVIGLIVSLLAFAIVNFVLAKVGA